MNIRLYFDHDASPKALVRALRARSVDIETACEAGMTECEDREHLKYAASQGRVLYSFNRGHFCRLHTEFTTSGRSHAGIVVSQQQRYSVGEQLRRLLRLVAAKTAEQMQNRLEFLSDWDWTLNPNMKKFHAKAQRREEDIRHGHFPEKPSYSLRLGALA